MIRRVLTKKFVARVSLSSSPSILLCNNAKTGLFVSKTVGRWELAATRVSAPLCMSTMTSTITDTNATRAMAVRIGVHDADLIRTRCLIGGEWRGAASANATAANAADAADADKSSSCTIPVTNPATGELLVRVPNRGATETRAAVAAAAEACPAWSRRSSASRGALLRRWNDLIVQHGDDLARIMVAEQGKPMAEAKGEVGYAASFVEWFAEVGLRSDTRRWLEGGLS